MELYSFEFDAAKYKEKPLVVMPLGDIQWSGQKNDIACGLLEERIAFGLKLGAWFIGMGDYIDYMSPSNRVRSRGANLYDNAIQVQEDAAVRLVDEVYDKFLKPTRGRWLGLLEGHHFYETQAGVTTDQILAQKLATNFLGTSAYLSLRFRQSWKKKYGSNGSPLGEVLIWAAHGCGGGSMPAAPVNKLRNIALTDYADVYLVGHMTKLAKAKIPFIFPHFPATRGSKTLPVLLHKDRLLVGTGGFSKAYVERRRQGLVPRGGYVEQGMMTPTSLGCPVIRITPKWRQICSGGERSARFFLPEVSEES